MPLNESRMLENYYNDILKIQKFFKINTSRSAKSQFLKTLKRDMAEPVFKVSTSMLNFMLTHTNGMSEMKDFQLVHLSLEEELYRQFQDVSSNHAHDMFGDWDRFEDIITFFNRNYLLPPGTDIARMKQYDKRLKEMIRNDTVNRTTVYFMLFLIYSE